MAKIKTPRQYRNKLEELNEVRAQPDKPVRAKRKLEGEVSAYGVELEGKETRRPKQSPKPSRKPGPGGRKPRRSS